MGFNLFMELYIHCHSQFQKILSLRKETPGIWGCSSVTEHVLRMYVSGRGFKPQYPVSCLYIETPHPLPVTLHVSLLPLQLQETTDLLLVYIDLSTASISCQGIYIICALLSLPLFTEHIFKVHPCWVYASFLLTAEQYAIFIYSTGDGQSGFFSISKLLCILLL